MDRPLFLLTALSLVGHLHAQPPAHHWPLDEQAGMLAPDVAGTADGTLQGNSLWQPAGGQWNGALLLNGNDARAVAGPCDLTTGAGDQLTLACWFKPVVVSGTERVLMAKAIGPQEQDFVWSLSLVNSTGARFRVRAAGVVQTLEVPPSSIFSNAWYHLAGTYDGVTMRLYLNSSLVGSMPASGGIGHHPQVPVAFGNLATDQRAFFGALDDLRLYDRSLDQAEVVDLVLGNVTTAVHEAAPAIAVLPDGSWQLPDGPWEQVRILDLQGRLIQAFPNRSAPIRPRNALPAGTYLVCLQKGPLLRTTRVVVP